MAIEPDADDLPEAVAVAPRRARFSPIWIVPIVAALVAIGIFVERILSEGPTITMTFKSAEGIEAGKSFVKYKDVNIGQVTAVRLSDDATGVEITAKMAKSAASLVVEDAKFWIVRPRVSLSGVSGLSTLLSGNYIGFEAGTSKNKARHFTGLEVPPIITGGSPGREYVLLASDLGSLGIGSPVYFRRLPVGQVVAFDLALDGKSVVLRIFVNAPYDKFVTSDTRFWNASGIDVSLSANGLDVRTQSLAALLEGGIAFEQPPHPMSTAEAAADTAFTLFGDRVGAMKLDESIASKYVMYFSESVRGLSVGAPVSIFGVPVGEVTDVGLTFNPKTLNIRPRVEVLIFPERMIAELPPDETAKAQAMARDVELRHSFMQKMVEQRGMRAQLATGSLVTGQRFVALGYFPKAPKARVDWSAPTPELPTIISTLPELEEKIGRIVDKLERVPLEGISEDLKKTLASLDETLRDARGVINHFDADVVPGLKSTLDDARSALGSAERMLTSTEANLVGPGAPAQVDLRNAMQEVARAARSLRVLADYLERHPDALIRGKTPEAPPK
ncbi:MAG TPA: MlaD family protein [Casimicrobiaceae bacterium]|nr:MlaD family protein [Casimicrobiaceae bacterium]